MSPPDSTPLESPRLHRNPAPTATTSVDTNKSINDNSSNNDGIVGSLGQALAGVNLSGQNSHSSSPNFLNPTSGAPFALAPGESDGWGNFVAINNNATTASTNTLENESGLNNSNNGDGSSNSLRSNSNQNSHVRNESLERFLSQSPSQTLGEEVFKFSHTNLPSLAEQSAERSNGSDEAFAGLPSVKQLRSANSAGAMRPSQESTANSNSINHNRQSPPCSVTGTTTSSRSVSPYGGLNNNSSNNDQHGRNIIHGYQTGSLLRGGNNSNLAGLDRSAYGSAVTSNQLMSVPNSGTRLYDTTSSSFDLNSHAAAFTGQPSPQSLVVDPTLHMAASNNGGGSGQVLYMAVPSPDGRGQVLQPVQMMQLPGKPFAYMVPQATAIPDQSSAMMSIPPVPSNMSDYGSRRNSAIGSSGSYAFDNNTNDLRNPYGELQSQQLQDKFGESPSYLNDPAIASLYSAPQRPPLDALLGQVRRLSRDQVGCRLVQQALDEEGPMAATLILQEGLPFWGEAMVDPFGNYLFQKILEKVSPEERIMLVKNVSTRLVNASLNLHGTRSVQKIVEVCAQDEQEGKSSPDGEESAASILTKALAPAAARLCIDSHGNHVIQRILLRLRPNLSHFIFDAVAASVGDVARHRHGCCVIQRCLDSSESEARMNLVCRIVEKSLELMQDAYGNYVVQYVLDVCSDRDVHAVCDSVVGKVNLLAIQKFSSNVMEKCLERCTDRTKEMYMNEISESDRIRELMMDPFGNYVVQRALSVATHAQAIRLVEAMRPHLVASQVAGPNGQRNGGVRNTAGGRRIIAKICRRFPNFTLNPIGTQEELYSQNKGNHRYLNHHQHNGHLGLPQQPSHHQHHHHGMMQKQSPILAASYAPVGGPPMQTFSQDPRLAPMSPMHQQQYGGFGTIGGGSNDTPSYYDPFGGAGGYNGM